LKVRSKAVAHDAGQTCLNLATYAGDAVVDVELFPLGHPFRAPIALERAKLPFDDAGAHVSNERRKRLRTRRAGAGKVPRATEQYVEQEHQSFLGIDAAGNLEHAPLDGHAQRPCLHEELLRRPGK
jgi:hypothetical protein